MILDRQNITERDKRDVTVFVEHLSNAQLPQFGKTEKGSTQNSKDGETPVPI